MLSTMMNYPLTLTSILERAGTMLARREVVTRRPDKSIHRCTLGDVYARSRKLAEALQKAGLQRGDRVATLMWNHSSHMEAYFGIPAAGGVLHTLNLRLHPDQLAWIVDDAKDRFLIVDDVLLPLLDKFKDRIKVQEILVVPFSGKPVPEGYRSYEDFLGTATGDFAYPVLDENEACGMCYTSGTTGHPKGVVYSHRSTVLHSMAVNLADAFAISQHDVVLPVVPMFHVNAWCIPYAAAMVGAKLVMPGPHLDAESVLELFEKEKVTLAAGVPTVWMGVLAALDKEPTRWKLNKMRMIVGGAAAPEFMLRAFDRHGQRVIHAWGMTETSPMGSIAHLKPHLEEASPDVQYSFRAKQGTPVPLVDTRVVNEKGLAPHDGKTMGELQVRGPWIAGSYYNQPNDPEKFTADGWFRTGDIVTMDEEQYIKITDRSKDVIKSGGEWISSVDLENTLMGHPKVKEAAVIGVPHPKWDERPLAVVVLKDGQEASVDELKAFLAPHFAKWSIPEAWVFEKEIPKTSAGKFLKRALRDKFPSWKWEA